MRERDRKGETDFGYTGQRAIDAVGLMDYNARWYGQGIGRFTQPDSIVPGAGNPQALNRYSYVVNNPVMLVDPTGHCPQIGGIVLDGQCLDPNKPLEYQYRPENAELCFGKICPGRTPICYYCHEPQYGGNENPGELKVASPENGDPILVTMPPGTNPAQGPPIPGSGLLRTHLQNEGIVIDLIEIILIANGIPIDEQFVSAGDLAMTLTECTLDRECYYGSPHPDLPMMLVVNQDVLVSGSDLAFGSVLSAASFAVGNLAGYEVSAFFDLGYSGLELLYDVARGTDILPNYISVGFATSENHSGLFIQTYILYFP